MSQQSSATPFTQLPVHTQQQEFAMKSIQVYDKPMCCSSGVCGPEVDPVLPRFAADLQWLQAQGHRVERFNLAQQPEAFIQNPQVHRLLASHGTTCLPLIVVDGEIMSRQLYPSRDLLTLWTSGGPEQLDATAAFSGGCCGGKQCC